MTGQVEQLLQHLYAEVLSIPIEKIGFEESFIGLGGDSFKAIKLKRKCDQQGIRLSIRDIFDRKTIANIAAGQSLSSGGVKQARKRENNVHADTAVHGRFKLMPHNYSWDIVLGEIGHQIWTPQAVELIDDVYPCSPMQEGIHVARETKGKNLYRIHSLFEIASSTTIETLASAWQLVIDRHESLRTVFVPSSSSSRLLDAIVLRRARCKLERVECQDYAAVYSLYERTCMNPPDYANGPPHRLIAYSTADGRSFCAFDQSHMISDGTSLVNMVTELRALLSGSALDVAPGYGAYIKHIQADQEMDKSLGYWKSYLMGWKPCIFPSLNLGDRLMETRASERRTKELVFPRRKELGEFCARQESTLSTAVQAAWALVLRTYTRSEEVSFGYTCSGRDIQLNDVDMICGPLVNLVVCKVNLADHSLRSTMNTIQADFVKSLPFQTAPFMRVQQAIKTAETVLFNTVMTVQYWPALVDGSSDLPIKLVANFNASEFDLSVQVMYSEVAMKMQLTYSTSVLSESMAEGVVKTFMSVLENMLDAPDVDVPVRQLRVISHYDLQQATLWNRKTLNKNQDTLPMATVHGLIEEVAARAPNSPAIYFSGKTFKYNDLSSMSSRLADKLMRILSPEQRFIPLLFEKSPLYSIALVATMKCGRAFVPVDINNPVSRTQVILEQLGITSQFGLILCSNDQSAQLLSVYQQVIVPDLKELGGGNETKPGETPMRLPEVQPSQPAYVIFTSGSTGTPKGVVVSHGAYAHAARTHADGIGIRHTSRVLQFASYAFDTSMEDHLTTFIVGACLCVPTQEERETTLIEFANRSEANWLHITPSMADMITPDAVLSLETMVLGGEPLTSRNVATWAIPGKRLIQVYGPSECSVTSTINHDVSIHRDPTNIGTAFSGCATWVTDPSNPHILFPIGAVGELLMEGPILAEGYLGDPSTTESAFVNTLSWAPGTRFYRTGDLVRHGVDGSLHFVGRADSRVKLRGQRIECGEIESHLVEQGLVLHAVVVAPTSGPAAQRLLTVVSLKTGVNTPQDEMSNDEIQLASLDAKYSETAKTFHNWLADRLPAYMLPDLFVFVRNIPMNSSRKLDRKRVLHYIESMSDDIYRTLASQMDEPSQDRAGTELERSIKRAWCHVLNVPEKDVNWSTSWFSSGGDSISAMMLSSELRKQSISISAADILRLRNIERLAFHVSEAVSDNLDARFLGVDLTRTLTDTSWNLSPIQQMSFQYYPDGDCLDQQTMVVSTAMEMSDDTIINALDALVRAHPMLLARFTRELTDGKLVWTQRVPSATSTSHPYALRIHQHGSTSFYLDRIAQTKQIVDLVKGPMLGVDVFRSPLSTMLSITIHHLVIDMVSWRTIFQDIEDFIGTKHAIEPETTSFQSWCEVQSIYSQSLHGSKVLPQADFDVDLGYWSMDNIPNRFGDVLVSSFDVDCSHMKQLLGLCGELEFDLVDVLSTAIMTSFSQTFPPRQSPAIFIEGHGREPPSSTVDLSRTVGWFTTLYPVALQVPHDGEPKRLAALQQIKNLRESTPSNGFDYFTSRFLKKEQKNAQPGPPHIEIILNFLGTYQQFERHNSTFRRCEDAELLSGLSRMRRQQRKDSRRYSLISIVAVVEAGKLIVEVEWNRRMNFQDELVSWPSAMQKEVMDVIDDLSHLYEGSHTRIDQFSDLTCFGVDKRRALEQAVSMGLHRDQIQSLYPCSPMQHGLMASLLRDLGTSSAYNQTFLLKITPGDGKDVGSAQIAEIWRNMVRKHAILRTVFMELQAGDYIQVVLRDADPVLMVKEDVDEANIRGILFESENQSLPFPLGGTPLHRLVVCQTADGSSLILLTKSHLLTDGRSTQILIQDFINGCNGVSGAYWIPQHHFADYIRFITDHNIELAKGYWATYLEKAVDCNFPKLRYSTEKNIVFSRSAVSADLDSSVTLFQDFSRTYDLAASNIFQLAWALVLRAYLNSDNILYGLLSSGRDLPVTGIQEAVGPIASILPIRSEIRRDMKIMDILGTLQADYIEHLSWQTLSLAQTIHAGRSGNQSPKFNTILNIQRPDKESQLRSTETRVEILKGTDTTEYGLALTIEENETHYNISLEYDMSLISSRQAHGVIFAFATAVKNILASPHKLVKDINLASEEDQQQIQRWDTDELETKNDCVHELIQATALKMPEKEAIYAWDGCLTYAELETLTSKVALKLISLSVQPGEIVTLCFEKSLWGIVAMIGVMKAGATFVHLDPLSPDSRKEQIIKITAPRIAIASPRNSGLVESLVATTLILSGATVSSFELTGVTTECDILQNTTDPSNVLYIIFTSGSTGEPKGVVIEHRNFCSAMAANSNWLQIFPSSRILQFSSFVFDACMEEILTALVAGACVCVPSDDDRMTPEKLTSFIQVANVNWAALTPSLLQTLDPEALVPPLRFITVHAEPMNASLTKAWSTRVHMRPSYGPTECTVTSTVGAAFTKFSDPSNIGWPVGCHGRVTDPHDPQRLVPIGAVGELVLEGPILARGYLNRPIETAQSFPHIQDWFNGEPKRVYRTGDLVRYAEDGSLRILGRRDTQIKVRGQRVELGEVKAQIDMAPNVLHSLVLQPMAGLLQRRLVAVVSLTRSAQPVEPSAAAFNGTLRLVSQNHMEGNSESLAARGALDHIRSFVSARLPSYMTPHTWFVVEDIPTLPSCKLDRKFVNGWLESLDEDTLLLARKLVNSTRSSECNIKSDTEKLVTAAWSKCLEIPGDLIDVDNHFISLGGDSISAMHVSRFLTQAGVHITTQDVLRSNSLRELATIIEAQGTKGLQSGRARLRTVERSIASLPTIDDIISSHQLALANHTRILSVLQTTPFQLRTALGLYNCPWRPYLYDLFAEIRGYELLEGEVDPVRLLSAWRVTVARHEILRTAILLTEANDNAYQVVFDGSCTTCEVIEVETETIALAASSESTKQVKLSLSERPIQPPLWLTLYTTPTKQIYMHLLIGHMLIDNVSIAQVYHDWDKAYREDTSLTEAVCPPQFAEYVNHLNLRDSGASANFWYEKLRTVKPTYLPSTQISPKDNWPLDDIAIFKFEITIDQETHNYCRTSRVTISTLLQFTWAVLLSTFTGQDSVCFGHITSDRDMDTSSVDDIVGPLLSILVTHVALGRSEVSELTSLEHIIQKLQHDNTVNMAHKVFDLTAIERQLGLEPPNTGLFNSIINYRKVRRSGPEPVMKLRRILEHDAYEQQILLSFNDAGDGSSLHAAVTFHESTHSLQSVHQMSSFFIDILALLVGGECRTVEQLKGRLQLGKPASSQS